MLYIDFLSKFNGIDTMKITVYSKQTDELKRIIKQLERVGVFLSFDDGLSLEVDESKLHRMITRNAGGSKAIKIKGEYQSIKVSDVRKLMKEYTAKVVAEELGISRATLYNRLKEAEEQGLDELF